MFVVSVGIVDHHYSLNLLFTITYPFCGFFFVINLSWLTIVNFAEVALVNKIYSASKKDIPLLVNENGRWTGMKT